MEHNTVKTHARPTQSQPHQTNETFTLPKFSVALTSSNRQTFFFIHVYLTAATAAAAAATTRA